MAQMHAPEEAGTEPIRIESYGLRIDVRVNDAEVREAVLRVLPPGWRPAEASFPDMEFTLARDREQRYVVSGDGIAAPLALAVDLDVALSFLESNIRSRVALWAPERIFVHAGVVARNGGALLIPGESFAGKTTLVAALVKAGAAYFSDEFAVLDHAGLVHPYAKPLSVRAPAEVYPEQVTAEALGGTSGAGGVPVAAVVVTSYVPGARWEPTPVPRGEAALALLAHTVAAQERPAEVLQVLRRVTERCTCVRGDRGEAEAIVPSLLSLLETV